jgi:pantoate kinase
LPVSEAICPAGISSFFEICNVDSTGTALTDPARIGARGGGFAIARGVRVRVRTRESDRTRIEIKINSKLAPDANTTRWALERLIEKAGVILDVKVDIRVEVPIGAGFGSSAAGTAAACLALADAAVLPVSFAELGRITHVAEVVNQTGLGTAAAVFVGGFVLVIEPGAPGIGAVDRLLFPKDHSIVCAFLEPLPTRRLLSQTDIAARVNPSAQRAMEKILQNPGLRTFLTQARNFGQEIGLESPEITQLIDTMNRAGAVGSAQNMIGKAVHGVVENSKVSRVLRLVSRKFPTATVFASSLDVSGVRVAVARKPKH